MPAEVTDQGAEATVAVLTEEPVSLPSEDQLQDAQASAQLASLFINYQKLRRARPKLPAESKVMPAIIHDPDSIDEMIETAVSKFVVWVGECRTMLFTIAEVGENNPGANVHLVGKDGRAIQFNGVKLYEALLRTEAQILNGTLRSSL